jgi:acetyltransferase-like isoleucine patch superfamily enzyme
MYSLALDDSGFITIGDNVLIGPDVHFITINHPTDVEERLKGVMYTRPIVVESACWIGARATLLPGAHVGYGCTIGAGAVVHGEIPDYSVAAGVPAKVVRRVFPREGPGAEQADRSMA